MHFKIIIIKPKDVELEDIMYYFQELDMTQRDMMEDKRAVFNNQVPDPLVPVLIERIYEYYTNKKEQYLQEIQYRATHSLAEYEEKYGRCWGGMLDYYILCCNVLDEYEKVKDLSCNDKELITFIKKKADSCGLGDIEYLNLLVYIKGIGFGHFDNPYGIWDFYTELDDYFEDAGFGGFLSVQNGRDCNYCYLWNLDVKKTLSKFKDPYEHIIFCKDEPKNSILYSMAGYLRDKDSLVDNTDDVLRDIYEEHKDNEKYVVQVVDIHC